MVVGPQRVEELKGWYEVHGLPPGGVRFYFEKTFRGQCAFTWPLTWVSHSALIFGGSTRRPSAFAAQRAPAEFHRPALVVSPPLVTESAEHVAVLASVSLLSFSYLPPSQKARLATRVSSVVHLPAPIARSPLTLHPPAPPRTTLMPRTPRRPTKPRNPRHPARRNPRPRRPSR